VGLVIVGVLVLAVFAIRVALFRRARIGDRARILMDGPFAPVRRIARWRRLRR
jgi:hypothetical protein